MNLKEVNEIITTRTGKLGDITRQLALAGIAVIWIFKKDVAGQPAIPKDLFAPGILIIVSLGFDLVQYAISSGFWVRYRVTKEKQLKRGHENQDSKGIKKLLEIEFEVPNWFSWPQYICLVAKFICLLIAYCLLIIYLFRHIPAV